jgi:1,2-phenylacetyl-CoA epoxidase catalytic subunit
VAKFCLYLFSSKHPDLYTNVMEQMKYGLRHQPKETVRQSFRTLKKEIAQFGAELQDGLRVHENIAEGLVYPGQTRQEWGFQSVSTPYLYILRN